MKNQRTLCEKIAISASSFKKDPFTLEDLVVRCHKDDPQVFGLAGYEDLHPDSNRVSAALAGKRGIVSKGWLVKVGNKLYTVTQLGMNVVKAIMTNGKVMAKGNSKIVHHWMASDAKRKFWEGKASTIDFSDACRFWGASVTGFLLTTKRMASDKAVKEIEELFGNESEIILEDMSSLSVKDFRNLKHLHSFLTDKFARRLEVA